MTADPNEIVEAVRQLGPVLAGGGSAGWIGKKLFGPFLDEVGKGWVERYSSYRKANLQAIATIAATKGRDALAAGHEASPRVVNRIISDGTWSDNPVMAEYFGGIWAAALSPDGDDDRGTAWADLVARLASDDIYLHYTFYDAIRRLYLGKATNLGTSHERERCFIHIPMPDELHLEVVSGSAEVRPGKYLDYTTAALALEREGLIDQVIAAGSRRHLSDALLIDAPMGGFASRPTLSGIQLFIWAHGIRGPLNALIDPEVDFTTEQALPRALRARDIDEMRSERQDRERRDAESGASELS